MPSPEQTIEYWKSRALIAEAFLDRSEPTQPAVEPPRGEPGFSASALDPSALIDYLSGLRVVATETLLHVAMRFVGYAQDRDAAVDAARRAGYACMSEPEIQFVLKPLVDRLLKDLSSGRQTIEWLSNPPKLQLDKLPVGAVFVHAGQLHELKREPAASEAAVVCYVWNRDDRTTTVDRKQFVQPMGRVLFDDRRKTISLGLLEIQEHAALTTEPSTKLLNG